MLPPLECGGITSSSLIAVAHQIRCNKIPNETKEMNLLSKLAFMLITRRGVKLEEQEANEGNTFFHVLTRTHNAVVLQQLYEVIQKQKGPALSVEPKDGGKEQQETPQGHQMEEMKMAAMDIELSKSVEEQAQPNLAERLKHILNLRNARGQTPLLTALRPYSFASCRNTEVVR